MNRDLFADAIHEARLARGPSRHLDGLAWAALHADELPNGEVRVNEYGVVLVEKIKGRGTYRHRTSMAEHYSETVESAGNAVKHGYSWRVTSDRMAETIEDGDKGMYGWEPSAIVTREHGATVALALLIAALELARKMR